MSKRVDHCFYIHLLAISLGAFLRKGGRLVGENREATVEIKKKQRNISNTVIITP